MSISKPPPSPTPAPSIPWRIRLRLFYRAHYKTLRITFLWTSPLILFSFGAAIGFAGTNDFALAYWSIALFAVCSIGYLLTSAELEKIGKPARRKRSQPPNKTPLIAKSVGCAIVTVIAILVAVWIRSKDVEGQLRARSGLLVPGDKPDLPNHCGSFNIPGQLVVALGSETGFVNTFPKTIVKVGGESLLRLDKDAHGNLLLTADIYDQEHNILASIQDNKYDTDSSVFKVERADLSSLTVYARKDKERVLTVDYRNPHMVAITGVFRSKTKEAVALGDATIINGRPYNIAGNCASGDAIPDDALFRFE